MLGRWTCASCCITVLSSKHAARCRLRKMVQVKEKSQKTGFEEASTGILTYPVLMAADILLYQASP